jgi:hypothetical protein
MYWLLWIDDNDGPLQIRVELKHAISLYKNLKNSPTIATVVIYKAGAQETMEEYSYERKTLDIEVYDFNILPNTS